MSAEQLRQIFAAYGAVEPPDQSGESQATGGTIGMKTMIDDVQRRSTVRHMTAIDAAWFRSLWLGLLIAASAALTTVYTCITPFAAFAVIAATTLSRRKALSCTVLVWLANQAVGFGVLNYPWTAKTFAWGVAIGGAAVIGTLAAQWTVRRLGSFRSPAQTVAAFVSAFALYQLTLYAVAVSMLGGTGAFVPRIIGQVLLVNAVTLVGLLGLNQLVTAAVFLSRRRRAHASPAHVA